MCPAAHALTTPAPSPPQYTETTELWQAVQELLLDAPGCRRAGQNDEVTNSKDYVLVPHEALEGVLSGRGALAPPPLSDAELWARLLPCVDKALAKLRWRRDPDGYEQGASPRRAMLLARNALTAATTQRATPVADRVAQIRLAYEELERVREEAEAYEDECDMEADPYEYYGAAELRYASVQLEDALHGARAWLPEQQGLAATPRAQLLELLRAAHDAGQDVLVYHNVC